MMERIFEDIKAERLFQEVKHYNSTCANLELHNDSKYVILGEEVGEIAKSLNDGDYPNLRKELIQVAAVCVAWVESIDQRRES